MTQKKVQAFVSYLPMTWKLPAIPYSLLLYIWRTHETRHQSICVRYTFMSHVSLKCIMASCTLITLGTYHQNFPRSLRWVLNLVKIKCLSWLRSVSDTFRFTRVKDNEMTCSSASLTRLCDIDKVKIIACIPSPLSLWQVHTSNCTSLDYWVITCQWFAHVHIQSILYAFFLLIYLLSVQIQWTFGGRETASPLWPYASQDYINFEEKKTRNLIKEWSTGPLKLLINFRF